MSIGSNIAQNGRTSRAVATQVSAMGSSSFEVGILDAGPGKMLLRTWTVAEIEHGMPWLRSANAHGHDIYVRPAGSVGLILLDDLEASAIARMKQDGLAPAVVVETSPENYQAWVRVSQDPIAPEQATMAARILAERYGGDPASTDWRHFGRLAGFTNRKPQHRQANGLQPFVLLRESTGALAQRGAELLREAEVRLHSPPAAPHPAPNPAPAPRLTRNLASPGEAYKAIAERVTARWPNPNPSRLDWTVCKTLACRSLEVDHPYLEEALRQGSPDLEERKAGHVDDYVRLTAKNVLQDAGVIQAREQLARRQGRQPELWAST